MSAEVAGPPHAAVDRAAGLTGGAARVTRLLRRHWPIAVLLLAGTALRVLVSVAYRPALIYIDSVAGYLNPFQTLDPTGPDPIGYLVLVLRPVLSIGSLPTVTALQHLVGLGMGLLVYALLLHKGAWRWLATVAAVPVLLDAYQVQIEHNIMSDTTFEALLLGAFAVLVWPDRPTWWRTGFAGLLLGLAVTVRVAGTPVVLAALLYVLLVGRAWRVRVALAALLAACFAVPVAGYAGWYHHWSGRYAVSGSGGEALYARAATFVDCARLGRLPDDERVLCPTFPPALRPGVEYWAHDPTSPRFHVTPQAGRTTDQVLTDFARRAIRAQPVDFVRAVAADSVKGFSWQREDHNPLAPVERWRFQTTFPTFPDLVTLGVIADLGHRYGGGTPVVVAPLATGLRWYQLHVGYTPGPVLALFGLLGIAGALARRRAGASPAWSGAVAFVAAGALVLLFADAYEFSWRYQLPGLILLPLAGGLGLTALARRGAPAGRPVPGGSGGGAVPGGSGGGAVPGGSGGGAVPGTSGGAAPGGGAVPGTSGGAAPNGQVVAGRGSDDFPSTVDEAALADFAARYGSPALPPVALVIAAYNEADGLGPVLAKVPGTCRGLAVAPIVVVDGATDRTAEVARAHGAYTAVLPVNRGQGAALRLGYHLARAGGARYIVTSDADGQYDLAEMPVLLEPLLADEADFVTGSRRLGRDESPDLVRRAGVRFFAVLVSVLTGHRVTDTSFGFRAMRAEVTGRVTLRQPQYQSSELLVGVLSHGYRVVERPMTMHRRGGGSSKKGNNLRYGTRYGRVVLTTWWRERVRR